MSFFGLCVIFLLDPKIYLQVEHALIDCPLKPANDTYYLLDILISPLFFSTNFRLNCVKKKITDILYIEKFAARAWGLYTF